MNLIINEMPRRGQNSLAAPGLASYCMAVSQRQDRRVVVVRSQQAPTMSTTKNGVFSSNIVRWKSLQPSSDRQFCGTPQVGNASPLGCSIEPVTGCANFALFSSSAEQVSIVFFTEHDLKNGQVTHECKLDPITNRTGNVWHILLPDVDANLLYAYKIVGPQQTEEKNFGQRYDEGLLVVDPYATAIVSRNKYGELSPVPAEPCRDPELWPTWPQAAACLPFIGGSGRTEVFNWEGDKPLNIPKKNLVVYEAHVRGFTAHHSSQANNPGTYEAMTERLDYLRYLGINCLELMPIQEFNELEYYSEIGDTGQYRHNYWGYSTVNYFAPMSRYSAGVGQGHGGASAVNELKQLVKECHKRGIEVVLDIVFNHTAEGNQMGPSLSFRGIDNRVYYMLGPQGEYYNYSGCGNTLNCNHPQVAEMIVDCLKYWVEEYHIDGFRFDLGSIMTRAHSAWHEKKQEEVEVDGNGLEGDGIGGEGQVYAGEGGEGEQGQGEEEHKDEYWVGGGGDLTGAPMTDPLVLRLISNDPVLGKTKLITEAWDCDGLVQVGAFPHYGDRWSEWNGQFRDHVRNFIKGTDGPWAGGLASALCAFPSIYKETTTHDGDWWANNGGRQWKGNRSPSTSVNFVTAHDGFTLHDLVSYNQKHNEANGENNNDGESHNISWNCGEEGETQNTKVLALRSQQMRNAMCALMLAQGMPMIVMGDEYGHTKRGNNNTYCHDDDLNWFDWDAAALDQFGMVRFTRAIIKLRKESPALRRDEFLDESCVQWFGVKDGNKPDWSEQSRLVAYTLQDGPEGRHGGLFVVFNAGHEPVLLDIPKWEGFAWKPYIDTGKPAPFDVMEVDDTLSDEDLEAVNAAGWVWKNQGKVPVAAYSVVVMRAVYAAEDTAPPLDTFKKRRQQSLQ